MLNYKLTIRYDGSRYFGWERQPGRETIQGKLEAVLSEMCGEPAEVIGAGRTDGGVHAAGMTANVHLNTKLTPDSIRDYLNHYLPEDIAVDEVKVAAEGFHARYKATGKLYTYTCWYGVKKPVFERKFLTVLDRQPDLAAMQAAAAHLIGEHDFKSFCTNPHMKKSTVRTVDQIEIVQKKERIIFRIHGNGFLQNMVRIIVGTLLEVGFGKRRPEDIPAILEAKDRSAAGYTAPAKGLCLTRVDY